jgi:hypothetical protein
MLFAECPPRDFPALLVAPHQLLYFFVAPFPHPAISPAIASLNQCGFLRRLHQNTSNLFYQVISTRHSQKRSTVITTNTPFSDWGNILYNTTIATAIADRLVENSEIFLLGGDSLRKANKNSSSPEE